ncbi:hypothetical protein JTB14_006144 [Gonioctena quinquepunctata]|nr:hypothetical protein JTB14_006144 [Gonioctena quinquepunctata]
MTESRKVLSSKNMTMKKKTSKAVYRKPFPKKTLYSNWEIRNDSSNVSQILHPHIDLTTARKFIHDISTKPTTKRKEVYRKCCLSTNTCYCGEKPIKPRLLGKPNECLMVEGSSQTNLNDRYLSRASLMCFCEGQSSPARNNDVAGSTKEVQREFEEKSNSLTLTDQRIDYEQFRVQQYEKYLRDLEKYESTEEIVDELVEKQKYDASEEERDGSGISTLLGTRKENSAHGSSGFVTDGLNIEELKKFRDQHYFETHAVDVPIDIPIHTCIHQFALDDRLFPIPINADSYGRSRCMICSKPMERDQMQLSKSHFGDKPSRVTLENFSKCYDRGLFPRAINIGPQKSRIELKLDQKNINQLGLTIGEYKRPKYTNTYALRQQKMAY